MDKFIELLQDLVPAWIAFLAIAFAYLIYLFKKTSDSFIDINEKQTDYLKDRVEVVDKASVIFTRTIEQQEKEIEKLTLRLNALGGKFENARTDNAERSAKEVETISETMREILKLQELLFQSQEQTKIHIEEITTLQASIKNKLTFELPKAIKSRDLSAFPIFLTKCPGVDILIKELGLYGYKADIYYDLGNDPDLEFYPNDYQSIWVGVNVPAMVAVQAMKIAQKQWTFLKYVSISYNAPDDIQSELYLGGATITAKKEKLKPWSQTDFDKLNSSMTDKEFHDFIERKNKSEQLSMHSKD